MQQLRQHSLSLALSSVWTLSLAVRMHMLHSPAPLRPLWVLLVLSLALAALLLRVAAHDEHWHTAARSGPPPPGDMLTAAAMPVLSSVFISLYGPCLNFTMENWRAE
eukprot:SAG11_NODE_24388_length_374_cov_0.607273_2_plen_106_part_01